MKSIQKKICYLIKSLYNTLFPRLCVCCGEKIVGDGEMLCFKCANELPRSSWHADVVNNELTRMLVRWVVVAKGIAVFRYQKDSALSQIVKLQKYGDREDLAEYMGKLAAVEVENTNFFDKIDVLVPVPLHPKRLKQRGYNQSEAICRGISSITGLPIVTDAVERIVHQSQLARTQYQDRNDRVEGAFAVAHPELLNDKHILVVDDVITTGSTMGNLCKAIAKDTNAVISVMGLARGGSGSVM